MQTKLNEIQPVMADSLVYREYDPKDQPGVPSAAKWEDGGNHLNNRGTGGERAAPEAHSSKADPGKTKELVEGVQAYLDLLSIQLSFNVRRSTGDVFVQVLNRETGEVIRQLPPEELLELREKLNELRGVLFHRRV